MNQNGILHVNIISAKFDKDYDFFSKMDPYCVI